jgi:hypothetical protein
MQSLQGLWIDWLRKGTLMIVIIGLRNNLDPLAGDTKIIPQILSVTDGN